MDKETKADIIKDIRVLEDSYFRTSKSMYKRMIYDYSDLVELCGFLGIEVSPKFDLKKANYKKGYKLVNDIIFNSLYYYDISNNILDIFKENNYIHYFLYPNKTSEKHELEIIKSFLSYYLPDSYNFFLDLKSRSHIIKKDYGNEFGRAFSMSNLNSYYYFYSDNKLSYTIENNIHELMHSYTFKLLKNYNFNTLENVITGLFNETVSLYTELSLYHYLINNNIEVFNALVNRNNNDAYMLEHVKAVDFVAYNILFNKENFSYDDLTYYINGYDGYKSEEDELYKYNDDYTEDTFYNHIYFTSFIKAFELLKFEYNGVKPKKVITDFLLSLSDKDYIYKYLSSDIDYDFIKNELKNHQEELEKKLRK